MSGMMTGVVAALGGGSGGGGISGSSTLKLNGVDQYANVAHSTTLNYASAMTLSIWAAIQTKSGVQTLVSKNSGGTDGYELYFDTVSNTFKGFIYIGGLIKEVESDTNPLTDTWYNVMLWFDGTNLKLYVNDTQEDIVPAVGSIDTNTADFRIGAKSGTASNFFNGSIAILLGHDDGLSNPEILEFQDPKDPSLYSTQADMTVGLALNGGSDTPEDDTSGNGNDATLVGSPTYTGIKLTIEQDSGGGPVEADYNMFSNPTRVNTKRIEFNTDISGGLSEASLAMCVSPDSFVDQEFYYEATSTNAYGKFRMRIAGGNLQFGYRDSDTGSFYNTTVTASTFLTVGVSSTIVGTVNTTTGDINIYIDGTVRSSTNVGATSPIYSGALNNLPAIGIENRSPVSDIIDAGISNVYVFNEELIQAEVDKLGTTPDETYYFSTLDSGLVAKMVAGWELSSNDPSAADLIGSNDGVIKGGMGSDGDLLTFTPYV